MWGIRFKSLDRFGQILTIVLSQILPERPNWFISAYMPLSDDYSFNIGLHTFDELCSMVKGNGDNAVDYICMFATIHNEIDINSVPATVTDYLESNFSAVFVCTDSVRYDFYCKDIDVLNAVRSAFVSDQICSPEAFIVLTSETDDRKEFGW